MTSEIEERCAPWRGGLKGLPYASIVPDRSPELKYHNGLHRAKSAVAYERPPFYLHRGQRLEYGGVRGGEIYERDGHAWKLLFRVEAGTLPEDLPWRKEV